MLAHSSQCIVLTQNNIFKLYRFVSGSYQQDTINNITNLISNVSGVNKTDPKEWKISSDCSRWGLSTKYFFKNLTGYYRPMNNPNYISFNTVDSNLHFALTTDGKLYKYSST